MSLRKRINEKCKDCMYDSLAVGTWLQQVTLCDKKSCALYDVRPKTRRPMPDSVQSENGAKMDRSQSSGAF